MSQEERGEKLRELLEKIVEALQVDQRWARVLDSEGAYHRRRPGKGEEPFRVQTRLYEDAKSRADRLRAVPLTLEPIKRDSQS